MGLRVSAVHALAEGLKPEKGGALRQVSRERVHQPLRGGGGVGVADVPIVHRVVHLDAQQKGMQAQFLYVTLSCSLLCPWPRAPPPPPEFM